MPAIRRTARWWKPSRAFSNQGIITHILDPNRSTACTNAAQNLPAVLLSAPSLPQSFTSRPHFSRALRRFYSTAGQLLLDNDSIFPKYLNKGTAVSSVPYTKKTFPTRSSVSAKTSLLCFLSNPLQHITDVGCA